MLTARIQNQMLTVALLLDVSIFDWTRLEATTNSFTHTSKLWCVILIQMSSVSINKVHFLIIHNMNIFIKNIWAIKFCLWASTFSYLLAQ